MPSPPYLGEIRMYGGSVPPPGWALCNGDALSIDSNIELFGLIGNSYGAGSGPGTFSLPDMRGRVFVNMDNQQYLIAQAGGAEQVSLQVGNLPPHTHSVTCSATGGSDAPKGYTWGEATKNIYSAPGTGANARAMSSLGITSTGKGKPHDNMIPFLCVSFIIALTGIYPAQSFDPAGETGGGAGGEAIDGLVGEPAAPDQYLSELRIFPYANIPRGWANCAGGLLSIRENTALFSLLGTIYGGDGVNTFALPNLQARVPVHYNSNYALGDIGGEAGVVLTLNQIPAHTHGVLASSTKPATPTPANAIWASATGVTPYGSPPAPLMSSQALNLTGSNVPHENRSPFVVLNVCIALTGIFPSRN